MTSTCCGMGTVVVSKASIGFFLFALSLPIGGCVAMKATVNADAIALLDSAIMATDRDDASCNPGDFSTENQQILGALRGQEFAIEAYDVEVDGEEVIHQFILKKRDSDVLLSADIVAVDGECRTYTFALIARGAMEK